MRAEISPRSSTRARPARPRRFRSICRRSWAEAPHLSASPARPVDQPPRRTLITGHSIPAPHVQFNFSEDITASVQVGDLALFNNTTMTSVAPASMSVQLDGANQRATWSFPGYTNGYLPDGNYTATIAAASVADLAGNSP